MESKYFISDMKDCLQRYGVRTLRELGQDFYDTTPCGPWTQFMVRGAPERTRFAIFQIWERPSSEGLRIVAVPQPGEVLGYRSDLVFLGVDLPVDHSGVFVTVTDKGWDIDRQIAQTVDEYVRRIDQFKPEEGDREKVLCFGVSTLYGWETYKVLTVVLQVHEPEKFRYVNYTDPEVDTLDPDECVGIRVGGIVEGSQAETKSYQFFFPMQHEVLDHALRLVNEDAERIAQEQEEE